jgi:predicted HicB family RNase H-like nuclease
MTSFQSSLTEQAVTARLAASPVEVQAVYNSRTADKFIMRVAPAVLDEVERLALAQGRSINAELNAALLDGLNDHLRSQTLLAIFKAHLGTEADQILAGVPALDVTTRSKRKFVLRLPETVRQQIEDIAGVGSMNSWIAGKVVAWVNTQRQCEALLTASMLSHITE